MEERLEMNLLHRIYSDYFMRSRVNEYEQLIKFALSENYTHFTIREYYRVLRDQNCILPEKVFIHRHDIDTDIETAKQFYAIEEKYGITATYYFRLNTLDFDFMRKINDGSGEASYHYEELATFAKKEHIKNPKLVISRMAEIERLFVKNFKSIESAFGRKMVTVASHGDFANRRLGLANHLILRNLDVRRECGIECEAYDESLMNRIDARIADRPYPMRYYPESVLDAINRGEKCIYLLTHPRQWRSSVISNTSENFKRLYQSVSW